MSYILELNTKQVKAQRRFDSFCRKTSKCRHERYAVSCFACPEMKSCALYADMMKSKDVLMTLLNER